MTVITVYLQSENTPGNHLCFTYDILISLHLFHYLLTLLTYFFQTEIQQQQQDHVNIMKS